MGHLRIVLRDIDQVDEWFQNIVNVGITPDNITGQSVDETDIMAARPGVDGLNDQQSCRLIAGVYLTDVVLPMHLLNVTCSLSSTGPCIFRLTTNSTTR